MIDNATDGIVLLNKAVGVSSNQALQKVKRLFKAKKAGHTGSLDVLASGMLPICLGEAVKFSRFLLDADKSYQTTLRFGQTTDTYDAEGDIISSASTTAITRTDIEQTLTQFRGDLKQTPPMFSALKHKGQPLYKLARQGIHIERPARHVSIYRLELLAWDNPDLTLAIHCSKGTYIRSLAYDIGMALGCGGHVLRLHRTAVNGYNSAQMFSLEQLAELDKSTLRPVDDMLTDYAILELNDEQYARLYKGQKQMVDQTTAQGLFRLYYNNRFIGLGDIENHILKAKRLLQFFS
ncbi:MAG: tRNA pseudouridine(55) synthase TruB [Pseudomonadota bacterium]